MNVQEESLRTVPSGPVDEGTTIKHWGVGGPILRDIQDLFRRFGVVGYLRERSPPAFKLTDGCGARGSLCTELATGWTGPGAELTFLFTCRIRFDRITPRRAAERLCKAPGFLLAR